MTDPFEVFSYPYTMTLMRRSDGGYANDDGSWKTPTTTTIAIKGHLIIGPYDSTARTDDHIISGRAKQIGLVVERGEAMLWTSDDVQVGDRITVYMDAAGNVQKTFLATDELDRPKLIEKLTKTRPGRRQLKLKVEAL